MSSDIEQGHPDGTLFIVSGPSGAGKTTLIENTRKQLAAHDVHLYFSVSHTTRDRRGREVDGREYHFVLQDAFEAMADRGEFIEWAHVHQHMYGTSRAEVLARLARREDVILDIDVQGARQISENAELRPHSVNIFVFPPSFFELERRLEARAMNTREQITHRVDKALAEVNEGLTFYDYFIINDNVDLATDQLKAVILARKMKSKETLVRIREMAERFKEERSGSATRRSG
jgi:guanylate kinase